VPKEDCSMKAKKKVPIEKIEDMAVKGKDLNAYFTQGQKIPPLKEIQRVNVDFTYQMLSDLDKLAEDLNISRQAVIKSLLMHALDSINWQLKNRAPKSGSFKCFAFDSSEESLINPLKDRHRQSKIIKKQNMTHDYQKDQHYEKRKPFLSEIFD
jgi:metal-responsive CopG/Arc/MetJ family transcriptional regulator